VFGLRTWLQDRYRTQALDAVRPVWQARRRIVCRPYLFSLPFAVILSGIASVAVARAAARGELTLGEMTLALQAIVLTGVLAELFFESDRQTEFGLQSFGALERFERLSRSQGDNPSSRAGAAGRPREEIRFEGVRFAYPGGREPVLRNLDLVIPARTFPRDRRAERRGQDDAGEAARAAVRAAGGADLGGRHRRP
jgi:ATP-binding cassette subfamily B protein